MIDKTKADLALVNAGGIRDAINAGLNTYKEALKARPFGNTVCTVDLTGQERADDLNAAAKITPGSRGFPQFAGVTLEIASGVVSQVLVAGQGLEPAKTYRQNINNFQASGGDGYPNLTNHPSFVNTGDVDADVLRGFIGKNNPLRAGDFAPSNTVVRR